MAENKDKLEAPGTFVLALVFLAVFIIIWFAHLKWLGNLWTIK